MSPSSDPSSSNYSPRSTRAARRPSFPWSHVVRGESDSVPASPSSPLSAAPIPSPELSDRSPSNPKDDMAGPSDASRPPPQSSDHGINGNATASQGKRQAWSRPSNGSIEVGSVMGAVSWPALSESTRAFPKLSPSDSIKDGLNSASPGMVTASPLSKTTTSSPNPDSTPHGSYRQKSIKRGVNGSSSSGSGALVNGGPVPPSPPPTSVETPKISMGKPASPEPSLKDIPNKNNSSDWDHGSSSRGGGFSAQPHSSGPDHHRTYGGNRRANNGSHSNRRDPERRGHEWNPSRNFSNRDSHMQLPPHQQRGHPRPFIRPPPPPPPPGVSPFISPPPPFVPVGYPDIPSPVYYLPALPPPESIRGLPFFPVAHPIPPTMLLAATDYQRAMLVKQIDYYFSSENLCKDVFLRQKMDDQGWVPISLIAGFNRVKQLTNNKQYILDAIRSSEILEVEGEKIRRRDDWKIWILPPQPNQYRTAYGPQSPATTRHEALVEGMQSVGLEEGTTDNNSARSPTCSDVASGNFRNHSQIGHTNGERNSQVGG